LSGVQFGAPYLSVLFGKGERIMDSHPPSIAHTYLVEQFPNRATEVASTIQSLIYSDGLDPNTQEFRSALGTQFELDVAQFEIDLQDTVYHTKAEDGYRLCQKLGITGYPAVLLYKNNTWYLVAKGWTDFQSISKTIDSILQSEE